MRIEGERRPSGALARHPQPIRDDDIDRAALNGDLGGVGIGELGHGELEPGLLIEAKSRDDGQLPDAGAGLLQGETQAIGRARRSNDQKRDQSGEEEVLEDRSHDKSRLVRSFPHEAE